MFTPATEMASLTYSFPRFLLAQGRRPLRRTEIDARGCTAFLEGPPSAPIEMMKPELLRLGSGTLSTSLLMLLTRRLSRA